MVTIGEKIKQLRMERQETQEDLAIALGISRVSIGNYERDYRVPDSKVLSKIARHFGIQMEFFTDPDVDYSMKEKYKGIPIKSPEGYKLLGKASLIKIEELLEDERPGYKDISDASLSFMNILHNINDNPKMTHLVANYLSCLSSLSRFESTGWDAKKYEVSEVFAHLSELNSLHEEMSSALFENYLVRRDE